MRNESTYKNEIKNILDILHGKWYIDKNFKKSIAYSDYIAQGNSVRGGYLFDKISRGFMEDPESMFNPNQYFMEITSVNGGLYNFKIAFFNGGLENNMFIEKVNGTNVYIWFDDGFKIPYKKNLSSIMNIINRIILDY